MSTRSGSYKQTNLTCPYINLESSFKVTLEATRKLNLSSLKSVAFWAKLNKNDDVKLR